MPRTSAAAKTSTRAGTPSPEAERASPACRKRAERNTATMRMGNARPTEGAKRPRADGTLTMRIRKDRKRKYTRRTPATETAPTFDATRVEPRAWAANRLGTQAMRGDEKNRPGPRG